MVQIQCGMCWGGANGYIAVYDFNIYQNDLGICRSGNPFFPLFVIYAKMGKLLPFIFYRTGLYLDILLITFFYAARKKKYKVFWISLPLLFNVASLMLSMAWQEFRYVWFVQLIVPFIVMYYVGESLETLEP